MLNLELEEAGGPVASTAELVPSVGWLRGFIAAVNPLQSKAGPGGPSPWPPWPYLPERLPEQCALCPVGYVLSITSWREGCSV